MSTRTRPPRAVERATYTVPEAAALVGISRAHAYAAAPTGFLDDARTIPVLRFGGRLVVSAAALHRAVDGIPA